MVLLDEDIAIISPAGPLGVPQQEISVLVIAHDGHRMIEGSGAVVGSVVAL